MALKVGSLFAGIGGIDLGFLQAGYKIMWAVEKDAACCKTYRHNFNEIQLIESDIRDVDPSNLGDVDVLTAGFPCQPFSIAGKQKGFEDQRGNLFYEVIRFANVLKPRVIFLENVPNLMEHDNGRTFLIIHNSLVEAGYYIRYRVLRSSEYGGVPQIRDRIYIVAFRNIDDCDRFSYPAPIPLNSTVNDIVIRSKQQNDVYYYHETDKFYKSAVHVVKQKDQIYRVYHDSIKPIQNGMCPTLTASMGIKCNQIPLVKDDYGIRKLTLRECLDFQGFPKEFYFPNTITIDDAYKQIGNSVCVSVIRKMAKNLTTITSHKEG